MPGSRHSALALALGALLSAGGEASAETCHPAMPVIRSQAGQVFVADGYARAAWRERASGGRMLDYARQIWRGRVDGRTAYLTFDEIPGTSGPNHWMDYRLAPLRSRPDWLTAGTRYDLGERFIIRGGPYDGEWVVINCRQS
jgi:hypothetical protein